MDVPQRGLFVPGQRADFGIEGDVAAQIEFVGDPVIIFLVLDMRAESVRIREIDAEQVHVRPARRIDPCTGIAILVPSAADTGILLDDMIMDAGALQLHGGVEAAHARADDHHRELFEPPGIGRRLPIERACPWIERGLLDHQIDRLGLDLLPDDQAQALGQARLGAVADAAGAGVAIGLEEIDRLAPDHRDVLIGRRRHHLGTAELHPLHRHRLQRRIAGQLIEQAAQHHQVRMADGVHDHLVTRRAQFRTHRRFNRRHPQPSHFESI